MIRGIAYDDIWALNGSINPELEHFLDLETYFIAREIGHCNGGIKLEQEFLDATERTIKRELQKAQQSRKHHADITSLEKSREKHLETIQYYRERRQECIDKFEGRAPAGQLELF